MDDARERFRNWPKFIDNSAVPEALLTEDGGAEQEGVQHCAIAVPSRSWQSGKPQLHRNIVKLTRFEGSIRIRAFQRRDDATGSAEDPPVGV